MGVVRSGVVSASSTATVASCCTKDTTATSTSGTTPGLGASLTAETS